MLACKTACPKCSHQFNCCQPVVVDEHTEHSSLCSCVVRCRKTLSGGTLMTMASSSEPLGPPAAVFPLSPQLKSPSMPITFVLPPTCVAPSRPYPPPEGRSEIDLQNLSNTVTALHQSGWYYEGITFERSDELLKHTKVGTFLVRNSSDPRYLFSLSMQTDYGPKSVRLFYVNGNFRLDAQPHLQSVMPLFPGVVELVSYYVKRGRPQRHDSPAWFDLQGRWMSSIYLSKPLVREGNPPSLKHLSRLTVNGCLQDRNKLPKLGLPKSLQAYLGEYPYSI